MKKHYHKKIHQLNVASPRPDQSALNEKYLSPSLKKETKNESWLKVTSMRRKKRRTLVVPTEIGNNKNKCNAVKAKKSQ